MRDLMLIAQGATVNVVRWSICLCIAYLPAATGSAWGGQAVEPSNPTIDNSSFVSGNSRRAEVRLSGLWSSLTVSKGRKQLDYNEPDPLGRVSTLNSETGSIPSNQFTLRWRGRLTPALPELLLQASTSYEQGQTNYRGYLQQGSMLTPYIAHTGNTFRTLRLRVGLPLNALTPQPWAQHVAFHAEKGWQRWQRDLTQYGETFDWQTSELGVMALWPLEETGLTQLVRFTLEADVTVGRARRPHVAVPTFGFVADLGDASSQNLTLGLHYALTPSWSLGLRHMATKTGFGASRSSGRLQFPGANTSYHGWLFGIGAQY